MFSFKKDAGQIQRLPLMETAVRAEELQVELTTDGEATWHLQPAFASFDNMLE